MPPQSLEGGYLSSTLPHTLVLQILSCACLKTDIVCICRDESQVAIVQIAEYGVIEKVLSVVDVSPAGAIRGHVSPSAFFLLLSTVKTCARASPSLAHRLLDGGMHTSVKSLLENSDSAAGSVHSTAVIKTQQQLLQVHILSLEKSCVFLLCELS